MATNDNTFGLLYDAVVISSALFGVGCMQGWLYFHKYIHTDQMLIKLVVAAVLILDIVEQGMLAQSIYEYLIKGHLDPLAFNRLVDTFIIKIIPSALIALMVQLFYAWRIHHLSERNWLLSGFVSATAFAGFVTVNIYVGNALKKEHISDLLTYKALGIATNALTTVTDLLISLIMVLVLQKKKSESAAASTIGVLNRLMVFSFNTGLPTSFCSLATVVSLCVWPDTLVYIFWYMILARLYTNSLLVSLNSRDYIRLCGRTEKHATSFDLQSIRFRRDPGGSGNGTEGGKVPGLGSAYTEDLSPTVPGSFTINQEMTILDPEKGVPYTPTTSNTAEFTF